MELKKRIGNFAKRQDTGRRALEMAEPQYTNVGRGNEQ
jgi:hypothetical protein